ncbi:3'-5' exonuclease, partial [Leucobacter komagatae]
QAFSKHKYGELFRLLGSKRPTLNAPKDKRRWSECFDSLISTSGTGTIGEMLDVLNSQKLFSVPPRVVKRGRELEEALLALHPGEELEDTRKLMEHRALRSVPYAELRALRSYLEDSTVFSTKHSVKGAEFDDVIVLIGRGWTKYDFAKMIAAHAPHSKPELRQAGSFQHSRNLFYVSASRAKHNLALLFVQELSNDAVAVLEDWAGQKNVIPIDFDDTGSPRPLSS